jgi:hypothetical protein
LPGESFPCVCEQMALFALLANGRGQHAIRVELTVLDQGTERLMFRRRIDRWISARIRWLSTGCPSRT